MLTSLLSLYIAANLNTPQIAENQTTNLIKTASKNFSQIYKSAPIKDLRFISPIVQAKSSIAIDMKSGETLYEKNSYQRLPIASITKLMTILIILEENKLDEIVTISSNAASTEGSTMQLHTDEKITIENLIYGAIINSANDAAVALAEHNAKTTNAFVEKMNKKALDLGLVNTHFSNPIGLDDKENYSSAFDIAKLGNFVYYNNFIKEAASTKKISVYSSDTKYKHDLESTNELLNSEYFKIKGLKTGRTENAGECLISIAENDKKNEIITVVLNSTDRFTETKILVDWIFRAYNWN